MQNPDEPRAPVPPPPPVSGESPLSHSGSSAHSPGRGPSPTQSASSEEPGRPHRRRRRSSSRRPNPDDYSKKAGKSRMFSTRLNQIALMLSAVIVAGLLIAGAYFYGRTASSAPELPRPTATAPSISSVPPQATSETVPAVTAPASSAAPRRQSESTWELVHEAFALFREGKLDEAYKGFETVRDTAPDFPGMTFQMAKVRHRQQQIDEAYRLAEESIRRGEEIAEAHILRGQIEAMQNSFPTAYLSYETAIMHDPHRPYAYFYWGEALRDEGRVRQAVERLQQAFDRAFQQPDAFVINLKLLLAKAEAGDNSFFEEQLPSRLEDPVGSGEWFVAAAALALMDNKIPDAAGHLATARERLQPRFYYFVIRDKFFDLYRTRPELSELLAQ